MHNNKSKITHLVSACLSETHWGLVLHCLLRDLSIDFIIEITTLDKIL